jgi:hypothetical protein
MLWYNIYCQVNTLAACYMISLTSLMEPVSAYIGSDWKSKRGGPLRNLFRSGAVKACGGISTLDWRPQLDCLLAGLLLL